MKKIFNHTKRPKEQWNGNGQNYDWDEIYQEQDEEYSDEDYYAEEGAYEGDIYEDDVEYAEDAYSENAYEEGIYEEDAEYAEGAYSENAYEEGVYEEDVEYAEDAYSEDSYDEGAYSDDDVYYMDHETEYEYAGAGYEKERKFSGGFWDRLLNMSGLDRIITITGAAVLVLAVVTGGVYVSASMINKQVSEFVSVGKELDGIDTIGEQGLVVLTDTRIAKLAAAGVVEDEKNEQKNYDEADYNKAVRVSLETTSVLKDLKIKFVNTDTEKLVANVPFAVTITKPDGKSEIWSDDDMDGIIYKKDITAGNYTLSVNSMTGDKYAKYTLPTGSKTVEVKKDITYKKVNVKSEIKKESEINLSKEEVKKTELAVESSLQDTVTWVESTTTVNTYREVSKSTIPDPRTLARSGQFMRLTVSDSDAVSLSLNPSAVNVKAGETVQITAVVTPETGTVTAVSTDAGIATATASGNTITITGVAAGSAAIAVTHSPSGKTAVCNVTVTAANSISLDKASVTVAAGGKDTINVALDNSKTIKAEDVTSSNTGVATVSVSGNAVTITGVAAGSAVITIKHPDGTLTAVCNVTVTAAGSISLDKKSMTLISGKQDTINVTLDNSKTIKAEDVTSSDTDIVTVSVSGNTVTVTGVSVGSADITIKHPDGNLTEKCTVTVKDGGSLLKDKDGNQVYVLAGDQYREAKYADYDDIQQDKYKVFIKGDAKYTGWQTIDGKVKFFNANGDYVTGEQVIQGAKYNFASDGSLVQGNGTMGIDVSKYNGNIDWNAVKNSGVSYVIIRVGYRGYTQGSLVDDSKFAANIKGATAAGLKVGVYFFSQAVDQVEAVEEASMVLERIKGYTISYPIFLDVEYSGSAGNKGRADSLDKNTRTEVCKAFCETIKNAGYTAGIYANKTWLTEKIDAGALSSYKIWLAQYAAAPTYKGRYDLWQYKSTGRVSGISGNVDMNISYLGY